MISSQFSFFSMSQRMILLLFYHQQRILIEEKQYTGAIIWQLPGFLSMKLKIESKFILVWDFFEILSLKIENDFKFNLFTEIEFYRRIDKIEKFQHWSIFFHLSLIKTAWKYSLVLTIDQRKISEKSQDHQI